MTGRGSFFFLLLALVALGTLTSGGCSISKSFETLSDSISKSFESSSSSSPDGDDSAWRQDVEAYAASFAREPGNLDAFRRGLSELAARRGLVDWESDLVMRTAVRDGLQRGGLDDGAASRLEAELYGTT